MGARGAFYILSVEQYTGFVSASDSAAFLDEFERLNRGETAGLFGKDDVGLMDKAWWGLFCILPSGIIDTDPVPCLGKPTDLGTQQLYTDIDGRHWWSMLSASRVQSVASSWQVLDQALLRQRYFALAEPLPRPTGWRRPFASRRHWYAEFVSEDDFEYVTAYCCNAGQLFAEASSQNQAVMFEGSG